jgi:hypothetical protein
MRECLFLPLPFRNRRTQHSEGIQFLLYNATRPPITPTAPRAHPAIIVFCAAPALLVVEAPALPEGEVEVPVRLGLLPPTKLAETPVLFVQWEL